MASEEAVIAQERVADLTAFLRSCAPISGAVILSNGHGALLLSTYAIVAFLSYSGHFLSESTNFITPES